MTKRTYPPVSGELLQAMFKARGTELARCFYPAFPMCTRTAIKAHSVQNSRVLDLLVDDGQVVVVAMKLDARSGLQISLAREGRHRATTFTGLCADHDRELFAAIEVNPVDVDDASHCFLLAYRAAFWEMHASGTVAVQMQTFYNERVRLRLDARDESSEAGQFAVERMLVAWQVYRWRAELDLALLRQDWSVLRHHVIRFAVLEPTVAASALFSVGTRKNPNDLRCVALTVLPLSPTQTVIIVSFKPGDEKVVRKTLSRLFQSTGMALRYAVSRRLLQSCQNFVLAPRFVERWSEQKRSTVTDYFVNTIRAKDARVNERELLLFA